MVMRAGHNAHGRGATVRMHLDGPVGGHKAPPRVRVWSMAHALTAPQEPPSRGHPDPCLRGGP